MSVNFPTDIVRIRISPGLSPTTYERCAEKVEMCREVSRKHNTKWVTMTFSASIVNFCHCAILLQPTSLQTALSDPHTFCTRAVGHSSAFRLRLDLGPGRGIPEICPRSVLCQECGVLKWYSTKSVLSQQCGGLKPQP